MKNYTEFISENDNLDRSHITASKFGIAKDPNKNFRPNTLNLTRKDIAEKILEATFDFFFLPIWKANDKKS